MKSIPMTDFSVLLYHSPDRMPEAVAEGADLYCAGHTHGGQVALPLYGAMLTLSKFGKRYEAGLYHEDRTWLYVNRGIGMAGGFLPRVRFWCRPELTITLQARALILAQALAPGLFARALQLVNALLPGNPGGEAPSRRKGYHCQSDVSPSRLTQLADAASPHYNELP